MPANHVAQFHVVVDGDCWLKTAAMAHPIRLKPGDKVALMAGDEHWLSHNAEAPTVSGQEVLAAHQRGDPLFQGDTALQDDTARTTLVCGHFEYDREFDHPFIHDLPRVIQVHSPDVQQRNWLESLTSLLITEAHSDTAGSQAVTERLAEVMFIKLLRAYVDEQKPTRGFLVALDDPAIYQALQHVHAAPQADLSLETIARHVGMSRSAFAAQFRDLIGMPPMQYVAQWRMHRAKELLQKTDIPMIEVADQVGYASEAAFHRAFKRQFAINPGAFRRLATPKHRAL